jgi:hypothetical protein
VTLRLVASAATALAPFSQNSTVARWWTPGSGQAQPGQSKPSGWFTFSRAEVPRMIPVSWITCLAVLMMAPSPAAGWW